MLGDLAENYNLDGILFGNLCMPSVIAGNTSSALTPVVTQLSKMYYRSYKIPLSIAVDNLDDALSSCNADWGLWAGKDLFDEYVPLLFANKYTSYTSLLQKTLQGTPKPSHNSMVVGLLCNSVASYKSVTASTNRDDTLWYEIHQMLILSSKKSVGVAIWFAQGVLQTYPQQFQKYWDDSS